MTLTKKGYIKVCTRDVVIINYILWNLIWIQEPDCSWKALRINSFGTMKCQWSFGKVIMPNLIIIHVTFIGITIYTLRTGGMATLKRALGGSLVVQNDNALIVLLLIWGLMDIKIVGAVNRREFDPLSRCLRYLECFSIFSTYWNGANYISSRLK